MILGMTPLTFAHVVLSLIGIVSGLVVAIGLLQSERRDGWTAIFLLSTLATSVTGFFFFSLTPFLPSHVVGILSLIALAFAVPAFYVFDLTGAWRWIYVTCAMIALYFNTFVLVVQLFRKIPALHALAPTESEPPFAIVQGIVLVAFVILTIAAVRALHPRASLPA
ncbi:MAG: hypothetical protein WD871_16325 [Xanthobacteraceae bacterium]